MYIVLGASIALAWALPDEHEAKAERFLLRLSASDEVWVPALWWYEVSNALALAQRRGRIKEAGVQHALRLFGGLPIQTDAASDLEAAWRWFVLARTHGLSAYDASYLELAERRGLPLASLDERLSRAARDAGIELAL